MSDTKITNVTLSELIFINKDWQKTRMEWVSYLSNIICATSYQYFDNLLPVELPSDILETNIEALQWKTNKHIKLESLVEQISIVLLLFYSDRQTEGIKRLKKIKCHSDSNNIVTSFIEWIEFLFSCILAILYDMFLYSIKVIINPLCWLSKAKRVECSKSCNRLNTLIDNYEKNKATDETTKDLSKQIRKCISVCKIIEG